MTKRKELGQHFLTSRHIIDKIIAVIDPHEDELIVEVGPGKGVLTFPLAGRCGRLVAVEKDPELIPALLEKKPENAVILEQDILETDFRELLRREPGPWDTLKVAGNLPYSISSPFLFKLLDEQGPVSRGVFLLQKEVAERVAAGPGSKKRAPLSILFELDFRVRIHFTLPPGRLLAAAPRSFGARLDRKKRGPAVRRRGPGGLPTLPPGGVRRAAQNAGQQPEKARAPRRRGRTGAWPPCRSPTPSGPKRSTPPGSSSYSSCCTLDGGPSNGEQNRTGRRRPVLFCSLPEFGPGDIKE